MTRATSSPARSVATAVLSAVTIAASACHPPAQSSATNPSPAAAQSDHAAIDRARADSTRHPYTSADIHFMSAMIGHHRQAVLIAGWAASHGASQSVRTLCERIINEQQDEISTMQLWLGDRNQLVPDARSPGMTMMMGGAEHVMMMPGMLSEAQLAELDAARGAHFDRLFLTFMIQHHRGAVSMVKDLFASYGAAQDETIFKFANDVSIDQSTEIARMETMLAALPPG